ncbi:hypothetical protein DFJ74DRAFT_692008, partial [Hyaloraphidium curvatum]
MVVSQPARAVSPTPSDRTLGGSPLSAPAALFPPAAERGLLPPFTAPGARDSMELYAPSAAEEECCAGGEGACWHCISRYRWPCGATDPGETRTGQRRRVAFDPAVAVGTTWSADEYERGCGRAAASAGGDSDDGTDADAGVPAVAMLFPPLQAPSHRPVAPAYSSPTMVPLCTPRRASSGTLSAFWLEQDGDAGKMPDLKTFWGPGRRERSVEAL